MRPLTQEETNVFFDKLSKYIGENIKLLIDRPDGAYCFRLHKNRVYYMSEEQLKVGSSAAGNCLLSIGSCFGKFTKTGKFHLHVTALDYLAPSAKHKVWLKPSAEQQFLYGHHVMKSGLGRITEGTEQYQGVIVYNMNDLPLGFGVTAKSTLGIRNCDPMAYVLFHQADTGEYIRNEHKVWLKPSAEQQFLYGHHVMKSGLGHITEGTEQYQGVIVYNMNDLPLGFGVTAKSTLGIRNCDPMAYVLFHQADTGEYIRNEDSLT